MQHYLEKSVEEEYIRDNSQRETIKKYLPLVDDEPFYIVDLRSIIRQVSRWKSNLPNVEMRYAVKCNPNKEILKILHSVGCGFDCASKEEIKTILSLGPIDSGKIIYANPCKQISHIKYAQKKGIRYTTLDSSQELLKINEHWKDAQCLIRISTDDSNSKYRLSAKFGSNLDSCEEILIEARQLQLSIVGVAFHVGSQCQDSMSYLKAIQRAREVFDIAKSYGFIMTILDIGGGFPGDLTEMFEDTSHIIKKGIDENFSGLDIRVLGEPGRYIVRMSHTLVTQVIGKKKSQDDDVYCYTLNDGVYQSFNNIYFDSYCPQYKLLEDKILGDGEIIEYPSTFFGPTCDCVDTLSKGTKIRELEVGDVLFFDNFGSYTTCCMSIGFNGFRTTRYFYIYP